MSKSIKKRLQAVNSQQDSRELKFLYNAILADLTAIRSTVAASVADITALDTAVDVLITKMNLDAGITDVDYAGAAAMTASTPSALILLD